jgi:hypothetical protein
MLKRLRTRMKGVRDMIKYIKKRKEGRSEE